MTVLCLQLMTVIGGLLLLILSFRKFVARKLTEELGIIWIVMAFLFIVCGCFKRCFLWSTEMNIFDAITAREKDMILDYIASYAGGTGNIVSLDWILRHWAREKEPIFKLFGEKLIVKNEMAY